MAVDLSLHRLVMPAAVAITTATAGLGILLVSCIHPRSTVWGPIIHRGSAVGPPGVALTFDDGPTPGSTEQILDDLKRLDVRVTFFVIGSNALRSPDLVRRMHAEGHLVGNHSFDHSHYGIFRLGRYWESQLSRTSDLIEQLVGYRPAFFRPPMGVRTLFVTCAARREGMKIVTWSRRAMDGVKTTPERILERLTGTTSPGDIIVLHDGVEPNTRRDQAATVEALPALVSAWRERGIEPVRLDKLLARST